MEKMEVTRVSTHSIYSIPSALEIFLLRLSLRSPYFSPPKEYITNSEHRCQSLLPGQRHETNTRRYDTNTVFHQTACGLLNPGTVGRAKPMWGFLQRSVGRENPINRSDGVKHPFGYQSASVDGMVCVCKMIRIASIRRSNWN